MPANGPHIIPQVYDKVQYFDNEARIYQNLIKANRLDAYSKMMIVRFFDIIDGTTTSAKLQIVEDMLEEIAFNQEPKIFMTNEGEDFSVQIDLEADADFTGYFLTLRNAADNTLISEDDTAGDSYENEPIQYILVSDLSLTAGEFYACNGLLEHPDGGVASGNAATLLVKCYILVQADIDAA